MQRHAVEQLATAASSCPLLAHSACALTSLSYRHAQGDGASTPQPVRADIASGSLHLFGLDVPLPIRGSGRFEVAYLDRDLRVFRSGGAISVQVRKDFLQQRRAAAAGKR